MTGFWDGHDASQYGDPEGHPPIAPPCDECGSRESVEDGLCAECLDQEGTDD